MNQSQMFSVMVIALASFALYLESKCMLGLFVTQITTTPHFAEYLLSLMIFLIILALIGEPYSSYLAGITVVALIYMDFQTNGANNFWSVLTKSS